VPELHLGPWPGRRSPLERATAFVDASEGRNGGRVPEIGVRLQTIIDSTRDMFDGVNVDVTRCLAVSTWQSPSSPG
jgi:hypothetical protein